MKKLSTLLIVTTVTLLVFWARKDSKNDALPIPEVIIVGTAADYKPFSFKQDNEIMGFDIDVIKEVVHRLHSTMVIKDMPFELLLPQLQLNNVHIIAAGMTSTPERALRVAFTEPHLVGDPLIIVGLAEAPTINSLEDITNKKVLVSQGHTADLFVSQLANVEAIRLGSVADLMLALTHHRGDYLVTSATSFAPLIQQYGANTFKVFTIPQADENSAFGINKEQVELVEAVNKVLHEMEQDGTLRTLKEKWQL